MAAGGKRRQVLSVANRDSDLRVFLRALWTARVPVASIVVAALLFGFVPEAQDLFIDIPNSWWSRVGHWTVFYIAAILFWVMPVNFAARLALQLNFARIGVDDARRFNWYVRYLPRLLSILCFVVIWLGFQQAAVNLPSVQGKAPAELTIASDAHHHLFAASLWALGLCLGITVFYWWLARVPGVSTRKVWPWLYDRLDRGLSWAARRARRLEQGDPMRSMGERIFGPELWLRHHATLVSVLFLLLIIFALDVLLLFICLRPDSFAIEDKLPRALFVPVLLGINVPLLSALAVLSHRLRLPCILIFLALLAVWATFREHRHDVRHDVELGKPVEQIALQDAVQLWREVNGCAGAGKTCPSPIVVAASGGASRAAFVTGAALAELQELSLAKSLNFADRLFAISGISGGSLGAAAFVAALDRGDSDTRAPQEGQARFHRGSREDGDLHCRTFDNWFACHSSQAVEPQRNERSKLLAKPVTRQVHAFLSRDFLTPVTIALAFRDVLRIGTNRVTALERSWENAWRHAFDDGAGKSTQLGAFERPLAKFAPTRAAAGHKLTVKWRPLLVLNGTSVETGRRIVTSPLAPSHRPPGMPEDRLFVDAYDFYEMTCAAESAGASKAVSKCGCLQAANGRAMPRCDIRLSTAVTNSARFPLISPPGNIRRSDGRIADRIVDGGYFENYGALTAIELAQALRKYALVPFILQITNDPATLPSEICGKKSDSWAADMRNHPPAMPLADRAAKLLGFGRDPLDTVLGTRNARGYHATAQAMREADLSTRQQSAMPAPKEAPQTTSSYAHVRICPQALPSDPSFWARIFAMLGMAVGIGSGEADPARGAKEAANRFKQLSASWWLSMPVQQYLHHQVGLAHNEQEIMAVLEMMKKPDPASAAAR
jgi:hypothetical protein